MALISISEAAKLAGIARSHLYSQYINTGAISVTRDSRGKPKIDTAELLRVFGSIQLDIGQDNRTPEKTVIQDSLGQEKALALNTDALAMIELLKEQLAKAEERERFYQAQLAELTQTIKLLEYQPTAEPRKWWQWWR
jgi:hypothetical protein